MGLPNLPTDPMQRPFDVEVDIEKAGLSPEALRKVVLGYVTEEKYDLAIRELEAFIEVKSEYPQFRGKSERYVKHCIDLIHAIRAKKRFPGIHSLTRSKIQELNERTMDHFNELAYTLRKIELIRMKLQTSDARSTLWFMRALVHSVWIVVVVALALDLSDGLYKTGYLVFDDLMTTVTDFIFSLFG